MPVAELKKHLLDNNLRDVCDDDLWLAVIELYFARHSHRFALVLLWVKEVSGAAGRNKSGKDLIRVFGADVHKNVALFGLVNAVHGARDRCYLPNVFSRVRSRACDWTLGDRQSGNPGEK